MESRVLTGNGDISDWRDRKNTELWWVSDESLNQVMDEELKALHGVKRKHPAVSILMQNYVIKCNTLWD